MRFATILAAAGVLLATAAPAWADARGEAWRQDLEVANTWLGKDRSYSAADRAEAERRLSALSGRAESVSDIEIAAELARIAALSGNAHTRAYLLRNRGYWRRYPIRIWRFADGYYVVAAQDQGERLLGRRILRVGGVPVERAAATMRPLFAGNHQWFRYMSAYTLTSPDALIAQGVIKGDGATEFEAAGGVKVRLEPMAFEPRNAPEEAWWFLSPAHPGAKGWTHVLKDAALPAYLADAADHYRFDRCEGGVAYFPYTRSLAQEGKEALPDFARRVAAELERDAPRKLIVDLRFNTGGDLTQGHPVFKALTASAVAKQKGRVFVIQGPSTFSAGITHAAWMKKETPAVFVGTSPGDELDTWAEGGNIDLPNSKLRMHFADKAHRYSRMPLDVPKEQLWLDWDVDPLTPDLPADLSFADYRAGHDPAMRRILGKELKCG